MFASLLAASRASSLGRAGALTVADIGTGRTCPSGSSPFSRGLALPSPFPFMLPCNGEWSGDVTVRERGPPAPACRGLLTVWVCLSRGVADAGVSGEETADCEDGGGREDEGGLINMDLVPSTNRPPRGGSFIRGR
jgi:hypothetical protein